ncbi:MAG TPA: DUF4258 domain-containing protein [Pyrinomonadaceae bacterium]|nr:DUF4258 domain-containing protein [Pyrinomonadaceae bacterium]
MPIKARPFKMQLDDDEVEGFFEGDVFVFRFYGLVTFRPLVKSIEEDALGKFAILQATETFHPDGFVLAVETDYDSSLECEWGYQLSLKRNESSERELFNDLLKLKGVDPNSVNLIVPPRQLISVYFDPEGRPTGSSKLGPAETTTPEEHQSSAILDEVRISGSKRILFLPHAVRQMSRPDRMITTLEVRNVIARGEVIEDYPEDPRGHSCLILGRGADDRAIHVICSPKPEYLAIITAYLPSRNQWLDNFRQRIP